MESIGSVELMIIGALCLLPPLAVVALVLYLVRRQSRQEAPSQGIDPFGQPWGGEQSETPTSYGEMQPADSPREYGATGGFRRVADQSASVGAPTTDDTPGAPRYGYVPEPAPGGMTHPDLDQASTEPSAEATEDPFALHAPSDDIEQTVRISRSSGEPGPTAPSWAAAIPDEAPEPVVEETVRRSDLPVEQPRPADPVVEETVRRGDLPTDGLHEVGPVEDSPAEEHTYWDDEEEEQARRAESLVDEGEAVVDGGYGWGSAAPFADGSMPPGHPVKGHRDWMQYHEPGSPWYDETTVDVWFTDAAAAERAGFHRA